METYSENSPVPNWPKDINKDFLDIYCTPVNQAIIDWLKILKQYEILNKFLSVNRENITSNEIEILNEAYKYQVDIILLRSSF